MSGHGYIYVRNWDRHQHYKNRRPAWIKNYLALLHDDAYLDLSLMQRGLLHGVWMLTAEVGNGRVPASMQHLRRCIPSANRGECSGYARAFERLVQAGFIEVRASAETERETETERTDDVFERPTLVVDEQSATTTNTDDVWAAYQQHHPRAVFTAKRGKLIQDRLRDFPAATLVAAVDGNHLDEFCSRRGYHALELILRDAGHIERYAAITEGSVNGKVPGHRFNAAELAVMAREEAER